MRQIARGPQTRFSRPPSSSVAQRLPASNSWAEYLAGERLATLVFRVYSPGKYASERIWKQIGINQTTMVPSIRNVSPLARSIFAGGQSELEISGALGNSREISR
jgi:hypothetical protein